MFLSAKAPAAKTRLPRQCSFEASDWDVLAAFWHPVATSAELTDRPLSARLLDARLVLWRTPDGVHAAKDLCMHRGGQLSLGTVRGELIVCPLHGFHYDGTGACQKIPALASSTPIPKRLQLEIHLCTERYGLVWVCLTEVPRSPLPEWPELESAVGTSVVVPPGTWHASAARHVENFNDLAHIPFVHHGTFGGEEDRAIEPYEVCVEELSLRFLADYHEQVRYAAAAGSERLPLRHRRYFYHLTLPFISTLKIFDVVRGTTFRIYDVASPVSAMQSRIFQVLVDETGQTTPEAMIDYQMRINAEDAPLVEAQSPMELPLHLRDEIHIPADRMSIEYRRALVKIGLGAHAILGDRHEP